MTGDGVNDALALKDADIGIAMGSGAPATRAVAQVVLLDGQFAAMPGVVAEGRRVIANVERVANLFVTKTVYAMLLAIAVGVARWPYPFLPRHLTIISSLTIGIPAFFLALGPSSRRYVPGFVRTGPAVRGRSGLVAVVATFAVYAVRARDRRRVARSRRGPRPTIMLFVVGLWVLAILARPFTPARVRAARGDGRRVRRRDGGAGRRGTSSRSTLPPGERRGRDRVVVVAAGDRAGARRVWPRPAREADGLSR